MPADTPTILATSGGWAFDDRLRWRVGPLTEHAIELLRGDRTRAPGDLPRYGVRRQPGAATTTFYAAAQRRGLQASHLQLFTMPNVEDITAHLLEQDVVWVWAAASPGCSRCGGCTVSTRRCAPRGRRAWC